MQVITVPEDRILEILHFSSALLGITVKLVLLTLSLAPMVPIPIRQETWN